MTTSLRKPRRGRAGPDPGAFTLIELLVVIAIIGLLVSIMVPVVRGAIQQAEAARTRARVASLANGCHVYQNDYNFYPGQREWDQLGPVESDKTTGSQWLVLALSVKKYAEFKADDLIDVVGKDSSDADIELSDSVSDRTSDPMAILYFPAKRGIKGLDQYNVNHNIEYIRGNGDLGRWNTCITDPKVTEQPTPYGAKAFLIMAAGVDREYLVGDITHPKAVGQP